VAMAKAAGELGEPKGALKAVNEVLEEPLLEAVDAEEETGDIG